MCTYQIRMNRMSQIIKIFLYAIKQFLLLQPLPLLLLLQLILLVVILRIIIIIIIITIIKIIIIIIIIAAVVAAAAAAAFSYKVRKFCTNIYN